MGEKKKLKTQYFPWNIILHIWQILDEFYDEKNCEYVWKCHNEMILCCMLI